MMKTKDKILEVALRMFNERGISEVTLRQIAQNIGISQGNLSYHFKTKREIVTRLYFDLVGKMNVEMETITQTQPILSYLYDASKVSMNVLYEYRFILKSLYKVLEASEDLKSHYIQLQAHRKKQFLELFHAMVKQEILRPEEFENEYERLYERMNILGDNWVNAHDLFVDLNTTNIDYYHELLMEVIYPYLTTSGKKAFPVWSEKR